MLEIIPAILTNDPKELEERIWDVERAILPRGTNLPRVQIDVVDGVFAGNKTISLEDLAAVDHCLNLDVHLMVEEPVGWVEDCVKAGVDRVIGHVEMMGSQKEFIARVVGSGMKVGLAIDLETPLSAIEFTLFSNLDVVLVMSVKAGFGGQEFRELALEKIRKLDKIRKKDSMLYCVCVDGGVNQRNVKRIVDAGAEEAAIGQSLFEGDVGENLNKLQRAIRDKQ